MTNNIDDIIKLPPYSLAKPEKSDLYSRALPEIINKHYLGCPEYQRFLDRMHWTVPERVQWHSIPPVHVQTFKQRNLYSVNSSSIVRRLASSGTSSTGVSRINLDTDTARRQTKALTGIVANYVGKKRLPMLVIDGPISLGREKRMNARAAGVAGFSLFAKEVCFALNEDYEMNWARLSEFHKKYSREKVLIFGFTHMIWNSFLRPMLDEGRELMFAKSVCIHGGGWKKMTDAEITNDKFKQLVMDVTGTVEVHNYYGMVEQTGSIFVECEQGYLHAPNVSDIEILAPSLKAAPMGELGVIKLCSLLPTSYPGHVILTDDTGRLVGEDNCNCGRLGKYFVVTGRLPRVEIRGCSDT